MINGKKNECDSQASSGNVMSRNRVEAPQEGGKKVSVECPDPALECHLHSQGERTSLRA